MSDREIKSELEKLRVLIQQSKIVLANNRSNIEEVKKAINDIRSTLNSEEEISRFQQLLDANCLLLRKDEADVANLRLLIKHYAEVLQIARGSGVEIDSVSFNVDDELFINLTIKGVYELNDEHPFIDSESFQKRMLSYYEEKEEYEKCAYIKKKLDSVYRELHTV